MMSTYRFLVAQSMLGLFACLLLLGFINHIQLALHQQSQLTHKPKQNLTLHFTHEEWDGIKKFHDREISIQGRMFDITYQKTDQNGITITGHFDTKEDHLRNVARALQKGPASEKGYSGFSFFPAFVDSFPSIDFHRSVALANRSYRIYLITKAFYHSGSDSPPPKDRC
ncbi:MAG: hypothetical protein JNJ58_08625 [Chitinophagaceae bacterium]|nr:hypothetical protein [Chitinophagaceae bacterium]